MLTRQVSNRKGLVQYVCRYSHRILIRRLSYTSHHRCINIHIEAARDRSLANPQKAPDMPSLQPALRRSRLALFALIGFAAKQLLARYHALGLTAGGGSAAVPQPDRIEVGRHAGGADDAERGQGGLNPGQQPVRSSKNPCDTTQRKPAACVDGFTPIYAYDLVARWRAEQREKQ